MAYVFNNWGGNQECHPVNFAQPASEDQLRRVVAEASSEGRQVKVVGAGHSWSDCACTHDTLVNLDRMRRVLHLDRRSGLVTVQAGLRLYELTEELDKHGLAMEMLGSIAVQSIAGVISTGTHGSGIGFGNMATQVRSLRLVTADGAAHDLSADQRPELFRAARVGLGALGLITEVTLQCVPAFRLEEHTRPMQFDAAVEQLPELIHSAPYVKLWWLPHTDTVQVFSARPTTDPLTTRDWERRFDGWLNDYVFSGIVKAGSTRPGLIPGLNRLVRRAYFRQTRRVDRSDRVFNLAMPPVHREAEFAVPVEHAGTALRRLRTLVKRENLQVNFIQELRFVKGDDAMLSPAHGRDVAHLGAYIGQTAGVERYFFGFERAMLELEGRPHWGKEFRATRSVLRPRWPDWDRFEELRSQLDPQGTFVNDFVRRLFR